MSALKQFEHTCCACGEHKLCNCARITQVGAPPKTVVGLIGSDKVDQNAPRANRVYICDACAEKEGSAPRALWATWAISWVALIAGLVLTRAMGAMNPAGIILVTAGVWVMLFSALFLIAKAEMETGKKFMLMLLAAFLPPVGLVAVMALRKSINHNNKVRTALQKRGPELLKRLEEERATPTTFASAGTFGAGAPLPDNVTLPEGATPCDWSEDAETAKMLEAIPKTWGVKVKPYRIGEAEARALERANPMIPPRGVEQAQYAVEQSPNSICWHEYGAWVDFKHAKFLYKGRLYYVNVAPTVKLTQQMYDRKGDLNNMAKILVCLSGKAGANRDRLVLALEGDLVDQT